MGAMSQRDQLSMSPDEVAAFMDEAWRAHVATINPDGTPHVVPLSYVVLEGRLTIWTDPRSKKIVNLRRDPRITCLIEDGSTFAELRAVQLSGRAELGEDPETSRRVGLALFERANGALTDELRAAVDGLVADRIAVTVHPERVVSWDHRKMPGVRPDEIGS
jgi:PPOX class probable F420-dependent enzyme